MSKAAALVPEEVQAKGIAESILPHPFGATCYVRCWVREMQEITVWRVGRSGGQPLFVGGYDVPYKRWHFHVQEIRR